MGYSEKTKELALELADNIEFKRKFDIDGAKTVLLSDFEVLCIVMQIWADNKRFFALDEFKKHLTDVEKQMIKLELAYRE